MVKDGGIAGGARKAGPARSHACTAAHGRATAHRCCAIFQRRSRRRIEALDPNALCISLDRCRTHSCAVQIDSRERADRRSVGHPCLHRCFVPTAPDRLDIGTHGCPAQLSKIRSIDRRQPQFAPAVTAWAIASSGPSRRASRVVRVPSANRFHCRQARGQAAGCRGRQAHQCRRPHRPA